MLKKILSDKLKEQEASSVIESTDAVTVENDGELEIKMILPLLGDEHEHGEYSFLLKQLKKRNPKAYQKIISLD